MTSVIIPTYNAGQQIGLLLNALKSQTHPCEVLVIDSSSTDGTPGIAGHEGAKVLTREREEFDHGGTRTLAARTVSGDILVYLTQDALPADDRAIENLLRPLENQSVAAVYGRQLPKPDASVFASHLRSFNYPGESHLRTLSDRTRYGLKTPFLSNSFAAYRRQALEEVGYFRERLIASEDTYAGAKLLLAGYRLAYAADAAVYHSHNYSVSEEFRRYFDIGVGHSREQWILDSFGRAEGEGMRFLASEISFLVRKNAVLRIPEAILRNGLKYTGYLLGRNHGKLPESVARRLSMNSGWWDRGRD